MLNFLLVKQVGNTKQLDNPGKSSLLIARARLESIHETQENEDVDQVKQVATNGFAVMRYLRLLNERVYRLEDEMNNQKFSTTTTNRQQSPEITRL